MMCMIPPPSPVPAEARTATSKTLVCLTVACVVGLVLGILVCVYADSTYLIQYTFSFLFSVSMLRIWIQLLLQWTLEEDSPRFKRLPALLKRHDASLLCRWVVFSFLLPPAIYGGLVAVINGPTASTLVKVGPAFQLVSLLVGVLSILDLSQRRRFDWRLHGHHAGLLLVSAIVGDSLGRGSNHSAVGLSVFGFLVAMDEPVWVLWSLDHLRVERSKEHNCHENDDKEIFPPVRLYDSKVLRKLNFFGFIHYSVLTRGGTFSLLVAYIARFASEIPFVWLIALPSLLGFFFLIDMDVVGLLYKRSKKS